MPSWIMANEDVGNAAAVPAKWRSGEMTLFFDCFFCSPNWHATSHISPNSQTDWRSRWAKMGGVPALFLSGLLGFVLVVLSIWIMFRFRHSAIEIDRITNKCETSSSQSSKHIICRHRNVCQSPSLRVVLIPFAGPFEAKKGGDHSNRAATKV